MTDDQILADLLRREGGYVNDPDDPGKATNFGITLATLSAWRQRPCTSDDVRALTADEACAIYRAQYLAPFQDADPVLRPQLVDIGVNSGVRVAKILLLQARVHAAKTGRPLATQLVIERLHLFAEAIHAKPVLVKFLNGWIARAVEFL